MKVKNIIVVCDFANITGGAERVAVTSAVSLAETDSNVVMFTGKGSVCDELKNSNVHVICLNQEEAIKDSNRLRGIIRGIYNRSARQEIFIVEFLHFTSIFSRVRLIARIVIAVNMRLKCGIAILLSEIIGASNMNIRNFLEIKSGKTEYMMAFLAFWLIQRKVWS